MAYPLTLSNGVPLVELSDGIIDNSSTTLRLIGKNYAGYGEALNENLIHMLEHFANDTQPANPLSGQLWWDTTNKILKVYSGTSWKISTGATSSPFTSPPGDLSNIGGDLWFDSTNAQLKVYSGSQWITVGPPATPATGDTGAFPSVMTDTSGGSHIVTQIRLAGIPYVIISRDQFTSSLAGFSTIKAGINFNTTASPVLQLSTQDTVSTPNTLVQRTATGAINVGDLNAGAISASSLNAPNITGSLTGSVTGNVTAPSITATTISASGISASGGITGTMLSASQPNITGLGTLTALNVAGNTAISGTAFALTATTATLNGQGIVTQNAGVTFSGINNTPIGNATPSTAVFTTIGGTLTTAAQPNITSATGLAATGNITQGTWSGNTVQPQYGGTGVNNGTRTLTITGASYTLNQSVAIGAAPSLIGTNFTSIPNAAMVNPNVTVSAGTGISGGGTVALGGTITINNAGVTSIVAGTGISISGGTGAVTINAGQALGTTSDVQFKSLGVGTAASGTTGEIRATNNITAFFSSDKKFKENIQVIPDALNKVTAIGGKTFDWTDEYLQEHGGDDGFFYRKHDFGIVAQDALAVFPEAVRTKPDGTLAVDYVKLSALAFAAIAELKAEIDELKSKIK
jgi:hypothetical protein